MTSGFRSPRRSKTRFSDRRMAPLSEVITRVGDQLNLDRIAQAMSVVTLWNQVIEAPFVGRTRAVRVKRSRGQNRLVVHAENSVIGAELTFHLAAVQNKLNAYASETGLVIHHIDIVMKPWQGVGNRIR